MTAPPTFGATERAAHSYRRHRPDYPAELFQWLAAIAPGTACCWDAGTGSGQAAARLTEHFGTVVASDVSVGQLRAMAQQPGIVPVVSRAEGAPLRAGSVDLVTAAQALHWFQRDAFYREADRVLRPGGVLAAWTYGPPELEDNTLHGRLRTFYAERVGPFWPPERQLVEEGYRSVTLPYPAVDAPSLVLERHWTLPELLGYVGTWSAVAAFREACRSDPRDELKRSLGEVWGAPDQPRRILWPLSIRAGRKPGPSAGGPG